MIDVYTTYEVRCDMADFNDPDCAIVTNAVLSRKEAIVDAKKAGWWIGRGGAALCPHCRVREGKGGRKAKTLGL